MMNEIYTVIFVFLSIAVSVFLIMICLTLFRIERTLKVALRVAERTIVKVYGRRETQY
ncbi:MAG: hypothetical protein LBU70_05420 [Chitinispirillales bacterium]|jgi:hypothetical protein|nr:hypothetical protein [Chitinispirillales bacterium]